MAEGERGGVLKMGAANLDDVLERLALLLHLIAELRERREKLGIDLGDSGNVHRGREAAEASISE